MDFDSEFAIIEKADFCIVLSSRDEPYILKDDTDLFKSQAQNLLVYAESIELGSSLKLAGKKLALVCNKLVLAGTSELVIDVSGANGGKTAAKAVGSGTKGEDGKNAGYVFISVEDAAADLTRLRVKAHGGDGGDGGATSDADKTAAGGAGGKGGDAGKIFLVTNNTAHEANAILTQRLPRNSGIPWRGRCLIAQEILASPVRKLVGMLTVEFLLRVGTDLQSISRLAQTPSDLAKALLQQLDTKYADQSKLAAHVEIRNILTAQSSSKDLIARLEASLAKFTEKALDTCSIELSKEDDGYREVLNSQLANKAGRGGRGGTGASSLSPVGAMGADGVRSQASAGRCLYLSGPGDDLDKNVEMPTFFPDQARRLIQRADALYLTNDAKNIAVAKLLYRRLVQRLYFVSELQLPANATIPVAQFFKSSIEENLISIAPLRELTAVLEDARTRLARIELGQNMFGQGPEWAPRLSYAYYEKRIGELVGQYKSLSTQLDKYSAKSTQASDRREAVNKIREQCLRDTASAQARLDLLLDENGPLTATAYKIRTYDPLMKDQQRHLKARMESVAQQVKSSINVSKIIDAFTTLASSESKADAAKNVLKAGYSLYQAATVVEDADGNSIDKSLLVKQITSCGDTLESLEQAIAANSDGSIALEDPGAVKVVTSKESISKMLDQFRNILPESMRTDVNKDLDALLVTVNARNSAVLEYNSLTQVVQELSSTKKKQAAVLDSLSQEKLQRLDPSLPSIVNWLRKTRDDLAMATMQQMSFASRAISYWGLLKDLPLGEPGPLRGAVELEQIQGQLRMNFDKTLNDYASSVWSSWPSADTARGRIYKLSADQVGKLKQSQKDDRGRTVYKTSIALDPDSSGMRGVGGNVRLRQIRLWLGGATVAEQEDGSKRRILTINLTHSGNEVIQKNDSTTFRFSHAPVAIGFSYECSNVKTLDDARSDQIYGKQSIESDYQNPTVSNGNTSAIAPLGPFTLWTITISERDNPGLDLSGVQNAWLEFYGRSKPL